MNLEEITKLQELANELPKEDDPSNTPYFEISELLEGTEYSKQCESIQGAMARIRKQFETFLNEVIKNLSND
jgi:hypothetical protein